MKYTVLFTAFLCIATAFTAKSNNLDAEIFDCNSIHATASVETLDRNYAYILETLISPGIWASREKINIQAYEVDFKELPKGIYRVICLYKGEADVSDLNTQSIIVSPIVKIDFCLSATKVQANNHTTQLLFGKDVMFFPNPANSQIQIMVKRDLLSSNSKIVIQNAIGSIVKEESIQETLSIIDVQMLNNGIYFINLISNDLPIFKDKVIIQHH